MSRPALHRLQILPQQPPLYSATFTPSSNHLALAGADSKITLWNPYLPLLLTTLSAHSHQILSTHFNQNADRLVSAGLDHPLFLWDLHTSTLLRKLRAHNHTVNHVHFTSNPSSLILSASYDATVKVWDPRHRNPLVQSLPAFQDSVTSVLSCDTQIIAASVDHTLRIFDIRAANVATDTFNAPVSALALSQDRQCLLVACLDQSLYMLERRTGQILCKYSGHRNTNYSIDCAFLADDSAVLSGSEDGNLYLWQLDGSNQPATTAAMGSVVAAIASHATTNIIAAATHQGQVSLWDVK